MNIPIASQPRVVIVGGGFGGLQFAHGLVRSGFQVVLVDRQNYHAFQPLLYQVATAGLEPGSIAYPFRKIFSRYPEYYFRMASLENIDAEKKQIRTSIGSLDYDYLVLALGAEPNFFGLQSIESRAMPMKTVSQALDIRSLLLQNFEQAILCTDLREREAMMSVIIAGGGPTGVELAGALAELRSEILPRDYPDLDVRKMDIHLVDANDRLLKEMDPSSSAFALKELQRRQVDVWLNTRVSEFTGKAIRTTDGRTLEGALLIWAAGVRAVIPEGIPPSSVVRGRLAVDAFSQVLGMKDVFAIGDMARMASEDYPDGHPMMAQPAMQQGRTLARNLMRKAAGKEMTPFRYRNLGAMATIGRAEAVAELPSFRLRGWLAWITWLLVHVYQLIGFRNKIVVMLNWALNYFRRSRDLRLIIRPFLPRR